MDHKEDITLRDLLSGRFRLLGVCPRHGNIDELPRANLLELIQALGPRTRLVEVRPYVGCEGCMQWGDVKFRLVERREAVKPEEPVLGDNMRGYRPEVVCNVGSCGDSAFIDVTALVAKFGPQTPWKKITPLRAVQGLRSQR